MNQKEKNTYSPWKVFKKLLSLGKPYIPWYIGLCLVSLLVSGVGIMEAEGYRRFINGATKSDVGMIKVGIAMTFAYAFMSAVLEVINSYFGDLLNYVSVKEIQSKIVTKLTRIKMSCYDRFHSADIVDRINNSAPAAQQGINDNTKNVFGSIFTILMALIYMGNVNLQLMLFTLGFAVVLPILVTPLSRKARKAYDEKQKARVAVDSLVQDAIQGAEVVRSFSLTEQILKQFKGKYKNFIKWNRKTVMQSSISGFMPWIVSIASNIILYGYGGYLAIKGYIGVGDMVSFTFVRYRIVDPLTTLATIWPRLQQSISSSNRVFEILDLPEEDNEAAIKPEVKHAYEKMCRSRGEGIIFTDVCFGYSEEQEVLSGVSFTAGYGKTTAFVGHSGSGKSTVLKLMMRLYEPDSGSILCNGIPINHVPQSMWRRRIAYVSQDANLFSGTIHENMLYGKPDATQEEITAAARAANIHEFIMNTPDGYQTRIGERGIRLSGGQMQRVSIARALLANPEILILDEPTSSLDSESEKQVQEALNELMKGRTTLVVAHRLSTIRDADKIVFFEGGRVLEEGTHQELMDLNGRYRAMYESSAMGVDTMEDSPQAMLLKEVTA